MNGQNQPTEQDVVSFTGSLHDAQAQPLLYSGRLVGPYEPGGGVPWTYYEDHLKTQLEFRGITDEKQQIMAILNEIGLKCIVELRNSINGKDPKTLTLAELWKALQKRYSPKKLIVAQRDRLLVSKQKPGQKLEEYFSELQETANHCELEKVDSADKARDMLMVQVFLRGLQKETTRVKLLQEADLTADKALELAQMYEQAQEEGHGMGVHAEPSGIARLRTDRPSRPQERGNRTQRGPECPRCLNHDHSSEQCKFRNGECHRCGKRGHIARACHGGNRDASRQRQPRRGSRHPRAHQVSEEPTRAEGDLYAVKTDQGEGSSVEVDTLNDRLEPPRYLTIEVNGKPVKFEMDTGAAVATINKDQWEAIGKPILEEPTRKLIAYQGTEVEVLGTVTVKAQFDGVTNLVELYVAKRGVALCGRTLIRDLKIPMGPHYANELHGIRPKKTLDQILTDHAEVFNADSGSVTKEVSLITKEEVTPKFFKARKVPYALKPKIEEYAAQKVREGIWKPIETSDWATPIVVVPKPGNQVRICGDYKVTVNPYLKVNQYPIPTPEELFHKLNGGQKFSKVDLKDAYMQLPLDEKSRKMCVIITPQGLFEPQRLQFGISSAPAIFQKFMDQLLQGIDGVVCYLDDVTVTGRTDEEHLQRLDEVLERMKNAGLRLKLKKCDFLKEEVELLGRIMTAEGVKVNPKKVDAIVKMPDPQNVKELSSFLGMVQYYSPYVPNLANLAAPLNRLKGKDVSWKWTQAEKAAVRAIKQKLISAPILAHFDPNEEVVLATDASEYGIGAVLYHRNADRSLKVIAYASRTLTSAERNYGQIEKEGLGIMFGVEKFNEYLYGRKFTLQTDHQPLVKIFGPKGNLPVVAAKRLHRWSLRLMMYSFNIEYVPTDKFGNADGLSRLPQADEKPSPSMTAVQTEVNALEDERVSKMPITRTSILEAMTKSKVLPRVLKYVQNGWPEHCPDADLEPFFRRRTELSLRKGAILKGLQVIIPESLQEPLIAALHHGHMGINRMRNLARQHFWFPKMEQMIRETAERCSECAKVGPEMAKTSLHPWEEPEKPWDRIHIDYAGPKYGKMWLIVVDAKSKWPEVIATTSTSSAATIRALRNIFATHGLPKSIVSDNGTGFTSKEFEDYCKSRGIEHVLTPPWHPPSNGLAERFVRTFKESMAKNVSSVKPIDVALPSFLFEYRVTPHPATGMSPAEILMGRKLRTTLSLLHPDDEQRRPGTELFKESYKANMKRNHDKKVQFRDFVVNDLVYARDYRARAERWLEGIVVRVLGSNTYLVKTDAGTWNRHADQLKRRKPYHPEQTEEPEEPLVIRLPVDGDARPEEMPEEQEPLSEEEGEERPETPPPGPLVLAGEQAMPTPPLAQRRNRRGPHPRERDPGFVDPSTIRMPPRPKGWRMVPNPQLANQPPNQHDLHRVHSETGTDTGQSPCVLETGPTSACAELTTKLAPQKAQARRRRKFWTRRRPTTDPYYATLQAERQMERQRCKPVAVKHPDVSS